MPSMLSRRLVCFYCGSKSNQKQGEVREFRCRTCEAVNHLDEHGDITDPSIPQASSEERFAHPVNPSGLSLPMEAIDSPFCPTCIQNQMLLTQSLAQYLPPSSDPKYNLYEANLPEFRRSLEERYPQVCLNCEPKVRERIRASGRAAAEANLRRHLDNTRAGVLRYRWRRGHAFVYAGAVAWWASLVGQLLWHTLGATAEISIAPSLEDDAGSLLQCFQQLTRIGRVSSTCSTRAYPIAAVSLLLGLLSIWWNPLQARKLHGVPGRMLGLREFYKLQGIVNVLRILSAYSLGEDLDRNTVKAAHAIMLVVNLVISSVSLRTARIDPRIILFQPTDEPLVLPPKSLANTIATPVQSQLDGIPGGTTNSFHINSLAEPLVRSVPTYHPSTPPPEIDPDAMDLDTPQMNFQPTRQHSKPLQPPKPLQPLQPELSPFYGRLPPAPMMRASRILNAVMGKPVDEEKDNIARALNGVRFTGASSQQPDSSLQDDSRNYRFAAPKLLSDQVATGLETMFEGVFTLSDEPSEIRSTNTRNFSTANKGLFDYHPPRKLETSSNYEALQRVIRSVLILCAYGLWTFGPSFYHRGQVPESLALLTMTGIILHGLFEALHPRRAMWFLSDMMVLFFELGLTFTLALPLLRPEKLNSTFDLIIDQVPPWLFGLMFINEATLSFWLILGRLRGTLHSSMPNTTSRKTSMATRPLPPQSVTSYSPAHGATQLPDSWTSQPWQQSRQQVAAPHTSSLESQVRKRAFAPDEPTFAQHSRHERYARRQQRESQPSSSHRPSMSTSSNALSGLSLGPEPGGRDIGGTRVDMRLERRSGKALEQPWYQGAL